MVNGFTESLWLLGCGFISFENPSAEVRIFYEHKMLVEQ